MWLDCPGRSKNCSRICESQTLLKLWLEAKHVSERTVWFCTRTSPEAAHKTCEELLWGFGSKGTWSFISRKGSVRFFGKRGLRGNKGYLYYIKRSFDTKILENNGIYVWGTREGKWNFQGIKETYYPLPPPLGRPSERRDETAVLEIILITGNFLVLRIIQKSSFYFVFQVLFSLRSIRSFAEYPQRIQQKLVRVGWYET